MQDWLPGGCYIGLDVTNAADVVEVRRRQKERTEAITKAVVSAEGMTPGEKQAVLWWLMWVYVQARPEQLWPDSNPDCLVASAGRGSGKNRMASQTLGKWAADHAESRWAVVGSTRDQVKRTIRRRLRPISRPPVAGSASCGSGRKRWWSHLGSTWIMFVMRSYMPMRPEVLADATEQERIESNAEQTTSGLFLAITVDGRPAAVCGWREWLHRVAHMSVLTAAFQRGWAYGIAASARAVTAARDHGLLPQWRAVDRTLARSAWRDGLAYSYSEVSTALSLARRWASDDPTQPRRGAGIKFTQAGSLGVIPGCHTQHVRPRDLLEGKDCEHTRCQ